MPVETELKLALAPEAAARLARHPLLKALRRAPVAQGAPHVDLLRYRRPGPRPRRRRVAAAARRPQVAADGQGPARDRTSAGGMTARAEFEWPVPGARLDPLRFAHDAVPPRAGQGGEARPRRRNSRPTSRARPSRSRSPTARWRCCASTSARCAPTSTARRLRAPIHEIELELEAGDVTRLYELAYALAADVPLALEPHDQGGARLRAARIPRAPKPVHAEEAPIRAATRPPADGFAAIIRACLAQIEGNAPALLTQDDPEWMHQMRIGVRRLRACLALARK